MNDLMSSLSMSASAMKAQSTRLRLTSENIANSDTPGYRRKTVSFHEINGAANRSATVRAGHVQLDSSELAQIYNPGHPMANASGYYTGSNVNLVLEIADARESQRSYEANLRMFDQARQMASSALDLLRR